MPAASHRKSIPTVDVTSHELPNPFHTEADAKKSVATLNRTVAEPTDSVPRYERLYRLSLSKKEKIVEPERDLQLHKTIAESLKSPSARKPHPSYASISPRFPEKKDSPRSKQIDSVGHRKTTLTSVEKANLSERLQDMSIDLSATMPSEKGTKTDSKTDCSPKSLRLSLQSPRAIARSSSNLSSSTLSSTPDKKAKASPFFSSRSPRLPEPKSAAPPVGYYDVHERPAVHKTAVNMSIRTPDRFALPKPQGPLSDYRHLPSQAVLGHSARKMIPSSPPLGRSPSDAPLIPAVILVEETSKDGVELAVVEDNASTAQNEESAVQLGSEGSLAAVTGV
eukprot:CAMPEP_0184656688 /NCGR_PEP_ID=MMETSP0308-20130426/16684_1 /TAXON_ID=38269 /ORGANISM="Gloeochaete witrockiana, Strain SAG 46.84" /LENGTH=336 /DNA_ID=CAMNT_0027093925 /DNA_START=85 /DNA_END=1095 /DNA_ORIENTATION=-